MNKEQGVSLDRASKALILLHGRGGSADDIMGLARLFTDQTFYCIAPQAPNYSWYPNSFMADDASNEPSLTNALEIVHTLIQNVTKKIKKDHIYLMGFSQGACLSLEYAARHADKYGGIIAFTGGLIGHHLEPARYQGDFKGTPIFIGTGDHDMHIPLSRSQESEKLLRNLNAEVTLKVYPGRAHTISDLEVNYVKKTFF